MTNQMLQDALDRSTSEIKEITNNTWSNGTNSTPDYVQVTNEKHTGKVTYDRDYYLNNYPLTDVSTTNSLAVATTDTTINVSSTNGFAASGVIGIGANKITYTSKTSTTFAGCTGITVACSLCDTVVPYVIEMSTTDSGSTPVWEILAKDSGYDINLNTGKVRILESSTSTTTYGEYPPKGVPNRVRVTYLWGNSTIPNSVKRLNLMMASKDLLHGLGRRNVASGMDSKKDSDIDDKWIESTLEQYTLYKSGNT